MITIEYSVPKLGLGTDFGRADMPISYARDFKNRFTNITGKAERRPGISRFSPALPGAPNLTRLHEFVSPTGEEVLMASDKGNVYRFDASASAWSTVLTGKAGVDISSIQFDDKLIFFNGVDRNFYTDDGGLTFKELRAVINRGQTAGGTNATTLVDGNITFWLGQTQVANNDIVYNVTRNAYGVVTALASAALTHTTIGTGGTGSGLSSGNQTSGDSYILVDYVDMNVIPQGDGSLDNVGIATAGTSSVIVAVSGVNFANTETKIGDFVYNTTRGAIAQIVAVSANVNVVPITSQTSGDSLVFFKSAMPIAKAAHVHYGRMALLDARNQNRVVFTAPDDAEDVTTFAKTLDSSSFQFGSLQPSGDVLEGLSSFGQYIVLSGRRYAFFYRGEDPIKDAATDTTNFSPVGFYPDGVKSPLALTTTGNDLAFISGDGLQVIGVGSDSQNTVQNNASLPIRSELRRKISNVTDSSQIQVVYYPKRSWLLCKVGGEIYNFNVTPVLNEQGAVESKGSWSLFDGKFTQQNHYFVRRNGDLLCCGPNGAVYIFDNGSQTDDGQIISTSLKTAWLSGEDPAKTVRVKKGTYIKPIFESGGNIPYTIKAVAGWDGYSEDQVIVSAVGGGIIGTAVVGQTAIGGTAVQTQKTPLRWRGEQVEVTIESASSAGPDVISGFTLYGEILGRR